MSQNIRNSLSNLGLTTGDALSDITGIPHVRYDLKSADAELFEKLRGYDEQQFVLCASVPDDPKQDLQKEVGIVEGHAYGILSVVKVCRIVILWIVLNK